MGAAFAALRATSLRSGPHGCQRFWTSGKLNLKPSGQTLLKNISGTGEISTNPVKPEPPRLSFGILKAVTVITSGTVIGAFLASYIANCLEELDIYYQKPDDDDDD